MKRATLIVMWMVLVFSTIGAIGYLEAQQTKPERTLGETEIFSFAKNQEIKNLEAIIVSVQNRVMTLRLEREKLSGEFNALKRKIDRAEAKKVAKIAKQKAKDEAARIRGAEDLPEDKE